MKAKRKHIPVKHLDALLKLSLRLQLIAVRIEEYDRGIADRLRDVDDHLDNVTDDINSPKPGEKKP